MKIKSILLALLLALALPLMARPGDAEKEAGAAAEESPLARFTPEQKEKLLAGEAIYEHVEEKGEDGKLHGHGQSSALIDAPIDEAFKIFCQYDKHQLYFPRKTKSDVVKTEGEVSWVHKEFDFSLITIEYTVKYVKDEKNHRVDFEMDPSYPHDLKDTAGYFHFEKVDEKKTLITYAATKVETGLKVPSMVQNYLTSKDLPTVVINIKKRIESGGTWTKED